MSSTTKQLILSAVKAIHDAGLRPTVRRVRAHILLKNECAPSFREIQPVLRTWRDRQQASRTVTRLFQSYTSLTPEQRALFRRLQRQWDRGLNH